MFATVMKQRGPVPWIHQKCIAGSSNMANIAQAQGGGARAICCGSGDSLHDCAVSMAAKSWKTGGSQHFDNPCYIVYSWILLWKQEMHECWRLACQEKSSVSLLVLRPKVPAWRSQSHRHMQIQAADVSCQAFRSKHIFFARKSLREPQNIEPALTSFHP